MPICPSLLSFAPLEVISSSSHNSNFSNLRDTLNTYVLFKDVVGVVSVSHTFTPGQTFSQGLTITTGGATITAGNLTLTAGNVVFAAASAKIIPGATSLLFRDTADAQTNLSITDGGAVTIRTSLSVPTITTTTFNITNATLASIIPSGGAVAVRNSANTLDVIGYVDATKVITIGNSTDDNDVIIGSGTVATTATHGFLTIPICVGTPTGNAAGGSGSMVFDTSNNKLLVYDGSWISIN